MSNHKPDFSIDLSGQTALVTGASSGLGVRFAQVLAYQGANVALIGRRVERLREVAQDIATAGGRAEPFVLDIRDVEAMDLALDAIENTFGTVSILINNAGMPDGMYATKMPPGVVDQVLETNLRGPFTLAGRVAQRLMACGMPGRIVNVASMLAFDYAANSAASLYSISKSAVIRMTEVLALEWASRNINVNAIAPGLFESEMTTGMLERVDEAAVTRTFPRGRIGQPAHLDGALLFLVSPSSSFVTGTVVKVDDGQSNR